MRLKFIKIVMVLIASLTVAEALILFMPTSLWWISYIVALVIAVSIHEPVSKWVDKKAPR